MRDLILLIQPNYHEKSDAQIWTATPPLGPCYMAAVLEKEKIPVEILDANVEELTVDETVKRINKRKPKYVGFSILTPAADWCLEVALKLPKSIIKIAGGPHPSGIPLETIKKGYDIVVVGEGEQTLLEIVKGKKLEEIKGIVYKKNRKIIQTPIRPPLDPNTLPLPARHLIVKGGTDKPYLSSGTRYFPWSPIFTSRGCPYTCYFCNKNIFSYRFRPRTPESIMEEIDVLVNTYHVKEIDFYDDNFNFDMERAEKIMDMIIDRKYKLCLRFSNGIRADKVSKKLLLKMKKAGTDYIAYGAESGHPDVIKQIPKGESLAQIKRAVKLTKEAKIQVTGFFILGLIGDTKKTMQTTIDFAKKANFDTVILNIATPYPGTRMWDIIKQMKGKIFINSWRDFCHTSGKMLYTIPGMATPSEVEEMYRKAYKDFYFRPEYIIKQIPKIFSKGFLPIMINGLKRIMYAQKINLVKE